MAGSTHQTFDCPIDNSVIQENFAFGIYELGDYLKKYAKQDNQKSYNLKLEMLITHM